MQKSLRYFTLKCKILNQNFKLVFLKTTFFEISTSKSNISASFALRRLHEVSFDQKFCLVYHTGLNSISTMWDLVRCTYTFRRCHKCPFEGLDFSAPFQPLPAPKKWVFTGFSFFFLSLFFAKLPYKLS